MSDAATIRAMYDRLAVEYARHLSDELEHKPLERELLARVVAAARGTICDLGCGPGHVAAFLHALGADVVGIDLSPAMIAEARARVRGVEFRVGSMLALEAPDDAFAGVVAAYAIVNLDDADIARAFRELARVLAPGGIALVSFHIGTETVRPARTSKRPALPSTRSSSATRIPTSSTRAAARTSSRTVRVRPGSGSRSTSGRARSSTRRPRARTRRARGTFRCPPCS